VGNVWILNTAVIMGWLLLLSLWNMLPGNDLRWVSVVVSLAGVFSAALSISTARVFDVRSPGR
jgi:hypothetical protein